jgi:hypothetical protein
MSKNSLNEQSLNYTLCEIFVNQLIGSTTSLDHPCSCLDFDAGVKNALTFGAMARQIGHRRLN